MYMKKQVIFLFIFSFAVFSSIDCNPFHGNQFRMNYGRKTLYSKLHFTSSYHITKLETLFCELDQASPCQLYTVAGFVMEGLSGQERKLHDQIDQIQCNHEIVDKTLFFALFCIREQKDYLHHYRKRLYNIFSIAEKMRCSFSTAIKTVRIWMKRDNVESDDVQWEHMLADQIMDYIMFEQKNILLDYENVIRFLLALNKGKKLPDILNFWSDGQRQGKLLQRVRCITPEVQIQMSFFKEILVFGLQAYFMAGDGAYSQWVSTQDEEKFKAYNKTQQDIQAQFEEYIKGLQANQQSVTSKIIKAFQKGIKRLSDRYTKVNAQQIKEQVYLFKAINIDYPIQQALFSPPVPYDQIFEASIMNTPGASQWYNIYQYGDWEFDSDNKSFVQNKLVLFGNPFWQKGGDTDPSGSNIFTEYVSNEKSYDIVIECTLYNCVYPFFVGVMFNRGRWISADPERIWQYRLCGLYGNQNKSNDQATRSINLAFAEQIITFDNQKETIISPLEQIATAKPGQTNNIILYGLPKSDSEFLVKNAVTYIFSITTFPKK